MNKSSEQVCRTQVLVNVMHELVSKKGAKALTEPGRVEEPSPSFSSLLIFHTVIPAQDPAAPHGYHPKEHTLSSAPCLDLFFYLASSHAPSYGSRCFPESWEMVANGLMRVNMLICYWKVNIVLPLSSLTKMSSQAYTSDCGRCLGLGRHLDTFKWSWPRDSLVDNYRLCPAVPPIPGIF